MNLLIALRKTIEMAKSLFKWDFINNWRSSLKEKNGFELKNFCCIILFKYKFRTII